MTTPQGPSNYILAQAQSDVANLRGQITHLLAYAEFLQVVIDTSLTMGASSTLTMPDSSTWTSSGPTVHSTSTLTLPDSSTWKSTGLSSLKLPGSSSGDAVLAASATLGHLTYTTAGTGADGNSYDTGHLVAFSTGNPFATSSTGFTNVTGMSASVAAGTYAFRLVMQISVTTGSTTVTFVMTSPALSTSIWQGVSVPGNNTATSVIGSAAGGIGTALPFTIASGIRNYTVIEGSFVTSASGTLQLQAKVSANTLDINQGSYLQIFPVI